ncbi:hypothetical protein [Bacillus sp. SG-1]|nr:hypothetical protein [Bacillus sp. SG-1]EDL66710.1 hypothetical protein BSG1_05120 [Bacillus sp. SG-1]
MYNRITKLTPEEIDRLLDPADKESFKDITWKFISDDEIENLLRTP